MFLSVLTKNLNWESLTKNLVTFNFIMGVHWKIWFFLGGKGTRTKSGRWGKGVGQFSDLRGKKVWSKRRDVLSHSFWKTGRMPWHYQISWLPNKYKSLRKWLHNCRNSTKTFIKRMTSDWGSYKTRKYLKKLKLGGDRC